MCDANNYRLYKKHWRSLKMMSVEAATFRSAVLIHSCLHISRRSLFLRAALTSRCPKQTHQILKTTKHLQAAKEPGSKFYLHGPLELSRGGGITSVGVLLPSREEIA